MIQIAIIEDNRFVREALILRLDEQADFTVSFSADNSGMEGLRIAAPRVLLLDVGLPGPDSLALAERVRTELPGTRVILMDLSPFRQDIADFVTAGVSGFVLKSAAIEEVFATIRSVADGRTVLPQEMTSTLFSRIVEEAVLRGRVRVSEATDLTTRERKVIGLIGSGLSNKAIAQTLGISPHTVKSHVRNVMEKLALHSRLEIAAYLNAPT